ncbi:MAG: FAD-dependent oxidoreductase [Candidatus Promineofilum sp.]|uniref:FAD-dependent oxidoreductase n=1 Tax=Promineifilum sp. TaxID=2664178 RepID=UPI002411DA71|nr:FAD-dependent oxidoreductase [Promineifilum sp.]
MAPIGTATQPLRVAIVGAGPAGFYAAERLFKETELVIEVDMFDRLPTPYGLVRNGVAPDHQKIKSVTAVFDRVAGNPRFRFLGNIELGRDVTVDDLKEYYHEILFSTGAQTDRPLGIPGDDLAGSYPATEFVAWYNGHPDYRECEFDLSQERVAVVGVGNVAVDVARILCRTREELMKTDIADYALEALSNSQVKEVYILGRRGPAQAAFTAPEVKELGELADCDTFVLPEEAELDSLSLAAMANADRADVRKVEIIQELSHRQPSGKSKRLILRFLVSPTELIGDEHGHVRQMKLVHNELYATEAGSLRPRATDRTETLDVGMVFRSIGYRGVPLPGVPFHESWGVIPNNGGRVIDITTKEPLLGEYTAGWIKRGPTGVIGTNKPDAAETVENMLEDARAGRTLEPSHPTAEAVTSMLDERQCRPVSFDDWKRLDEFELNRGKAEGRPRVKFTRIEDMLAALRS